MASTIDKPALPSNARFGALFAGVFAAAAAYKFWRGSLPAAAVLGLVAASFAILSLARPALLTPLNKVWFAFGQLLNRVVSPVVLGILFFLIITPVALIGRLFGRDPLRMRKRAIPSYWITRDPSGPARDSFKHQF
ncbi:MAG: SxtJ family membrane protein [Steroidobacteraceae bacterium]